MGINGIVSYLETITKHFSPIQIHSLALGLFASLVAPFGGFLMSAIKRAFNLKDFDSIIPGHGGLTDRCDCQLLMLWFVSVYYKFFLKHWQPLTEKCKEFDPDPDTLKNICTGLDTDTLKNICRATCEAINTAVSPDNITPT